MDYFEIRIHPASEEKREILTSLLAEEQFESFVETEDELLAYIQVNNYFREKVEQICDQFEVKFAEKRIPDQNWNAEWEKNFEPVLIGGKCYIRAPFHAPRPDVPFEIIIEPKMSFGTAHHETTAMMIEMMMHMDFRGKKVLDMGCGTGILAILACKMGASEVDAIDNNSWAFNNAMENMEKNGASAVTVAGNRPGHGIGDDRRQWLPLPGALRHALMRLRQAVARRTETAGHGHQLLPPPGQPASGHRHQGDGEAELHAEREAAFAQIAEFRGSGVPVDGTRGPWGLALHPEVRGDSRTSLGTKGRSLELSSTDPASMVQGSAYASHLTMKASNWWVARQSGRAPHPFFTNSAG